MKILVNSYNTIMQSKAGGAKERFICLFNELRNQGVSIKVFDAFSDDVADYDLLHIFNLDTENVALIRCAKSLGKKVVLSSIINTTGRFSLMVYKALSYAPIETVYTMYKRALDMSDLIIAETYAEKNHISKYYGIKKDKITVIPNGAVLYDKTNDIYVECDMKIGTPYVLQVGRFDTNKNQLRSIKALKSTGVHFVLVGGPTSVDDLYYKQCIDEAEGNNNIHFLGWLDKSSKLFQSAYANASVLVCPSFYETFGLTIIEGAVNGANLAISNRLPIMEYPEISNCLSFDPSSIVDIREKVLLALSHSDPVLTARCRDSFTWERVANQHYISYTNLYKNELNKE